ncbi:plastid division protein PDV1-like isoform X1 [Chenopodium quinoa]|uniref:plastid division protein PDV1-like isoform X1 n=1 Tax=Chenopodium quinoa TaxID=63459 RepID=UPI000B774A5C|nr:plastid division protein PDV1-like isoform X1 [Chenopodium quinoa]
MTLKMKRDVEMDEVEAVLEKIWDLHDKLSDEIHSISRTHFANSTKSLKNSNTHENNFKNNNIKHQSQPQNHFFDHDFKDYNNINTNGFVFFKDFDKNCAIAEAKSLNSIRSALENLEEQLEFFHIGTFPVCTKDWEKRKKRQTVQIQQRAERDAALARLEQSRIVLALRLAEHHGKRYKVIDEAMDFVGNVRDATCFVGPDNFSNPPASAPAEHSMQKKGVSSNIFVRLLFSGLDSAKRTLQLDKLGGVLGNAALFALSMVALLHLQQATSKDNNMLDSAQNQDRRTVKKILQREGSSSTGQLNPLDVRLARG